MEYNYLAIILTENCNACCKMCCDSRGIVRGKTLNFTEINTILSQVKNYSYIDTIGITGGEPMLYPDLCEYIFNYNYDKNMKFTIKTNGFWGKNKEKARLFLEKNHHKISRISFSYDEFHKEFIDIENIKHLIELCSDYKIYTDVVGCFSKVGMQPGDILNLLGEHAYLTKFVYQPILKTGRALDLGLKDEEFVNMLDVDKHDIKCLITASQDYTLLVNTQLKVYPCCSQFIENTILEIGDLHTESLNNIIDDLKHNKIFNTIFTQGFTPFLQFMKEHNISYPKNLSSHCELCGYLFSNTWFIEKLAEEGFYED